MKKIINYLLVILVFVLPWQTRYIYHYGMLNNGPWEYGTFAVYGAEILLWLILILFAVDNFFKKEFWLRIKTGSRPKYLSFLPLVFFVLLFLSLFASRNFDVSYHYIFILLETMCLSSVIFMSRINTRYAVGAIWLAGIAQGVLAIWQFFSQKVFAFKWLGMAEQLGKTPGAAAVEFGDQRWLRAYGAFSWPNALGIFLAIALLFGVYLYVNEKNKRRKIIISVGQIFITIGLLLSFSRSAWLALFVGVVVLIVCLKRQKANEFLAQFWKQTGFFLAALAVLVVILYPIFAARFNFNNRLEQRSLNERGQQYAEAWQIIKQSPLLGVGPGAYTYAMFSRYPNLGSWQYQPVHNIYALMAVEMGIPLAVFFLLYFCYIFYRVVKSSPFFASVLSALLVFGLFDHWLFSLFPGLLFFWAVVGVAMGDGGRKN